MAMKYNIVICMIVILLYLHMCSALFFRKKICRGALRNRRKIIIDADPGGDDALALMLALRYEVKKCDIEILAITSTYGNAYLEDTTQNLLKILTVANRSDVPVYVGSANPLTNPYKFDYYFGMDGFGDFEFTQKITAKADKNKHAAVLLVELVNKHPGQITIVALGPLTNIALAIMLEPNFLNKTKEVVIMGATIYTEPTAPEIEFNFKQDPESNWITLNKYDKIHTVFPIDTVIAHNISKEERGEIFNKLNPQVSEFLTLAERIPLENATSWEPADGITIATVLKPEIVINSFKTNLEPELVGDKRGAVVVDWNSTVYNAKIIQNVDVPAFKNFIIECLS